MNFRKDVEDIRNKINKSVFASLLIPILFGYSNKDVGLFLFLTCAWIVIFTTYVLILVLHSNASSRMLFVTILFLINTISLIFVLVMLFQNFSS